MTNKEIISKAKTAKSSEELLKMAHDNGLKDFSKENADEYFKILNHRGELSDDELSNAAGGGCRKNGKLVVTHGNICEAANGWQCKKCQKHTDECPCHGPVAADFFGVSIDVGAKGVCGTCMYMIREGGLWVCNSPVINH